LAEKELLFNYLNRAGWTLDLAGSANKARVVIYDGCLSFFEFEDIDRTYVNASSISIAFSNIDFDLDHE
jgi:hypothetical protein